MMELLFTEKISKFIQINPFIIIVCLIVGLLCLYVVIFLIHKPILRFLNKRQKMINDNITQTIQNNKKSDEYLKDREKLLKITKNKLNKLQFEVYENNKNLKTKILLEAKKEAKTILLNNTLEIKKLKSTFKKNSKQYILDCSFLLCEKILENKITKKEHQKLFDELIDSI